MNFCQTWRGHLGHFDLKYRLHSIDEILLGKVLGVELIGHKVGVHLTVKQFSKVVESFYIPTQSNSSFFHLKQPQFEKKEKQKLVLMKISGNE